MFGQVLDTDMFCHRHRLPSQPAHLRRPLPLACPAAAARYAPHHHKWYKPYDNHLRIYEQTAANLPKAAAERAARLAEMQVNHDRKHRGSQTSQEINTRVKAHHDTVSVKQNIPKSVVGEGDEYTVVTTVTHSTSAAQKKKEG